MGMIWFRIVPVVVGFIAVVAGVGFRFGWDWSAIVGGCFLMCAALVDVGGDE